MKIIDFHTHAFPDALAARAMPHLEHEGNTKAALDGKISSLLNSMDAAGIGRSVVCSIATKPVQFDGIMTWSKAIASERLLPFPSVHPDDAEAVERVRAIHAAGFKGIKLHPYYQSFDLDEERVFPIYAEADWLNLAILMHTGFDLAYPRDCKADPVRTANVVRQFPHLKFVTTHLGAWEDWDEVRKHLLGKPVYMDISYSIDDMGRGAAREFMLAHPAEYLVFGTDSPWADQKEAIDILRALKLGAEREELILFRNAQRLLGEQ
jgi:uncharacterized protein